MVDILFFEFEKYGLNKLLIPQKNSGEYFCWVWPVESTVDIQWRLLNTVNSSEGSSWMRKKGAGHQIIVPSYLILGKEISYLKHWKSYLKHWKNHVVRNHHIWFLKKSFCGFFVRKHCRIVDSCIYFISIHYKIAIQI